MEINRISVDQLQLIAGPCSAESEEQIMNIGAQLASNKKVSLFRAGLWKPRTRPGSFEGVGAVGLKWLQQVTREYGLECTTEVATAQHVEEVLKHGLKTIWIGARTTVNPFAVAEIAQAVQGTELSVMIKNPINPDVELWLGAVERIANVGTQEITLIHRGFSTPQDSIYRNEPLWNLPLDLKKRLPQLKLLCDPSHIAGRKDLVNPVAQQAVEYGFDGLMIEVHNEPAKAWSDQKQQITPEELWSLWNGLGNNSIDPINLIANLRQVVDGVDQQLIDLLEQRMQMVEDIGQIKHRANLQVYQEARWKQMLQDLKEKGSSKGLSNELIDRVFSAIHSESIHRQQNNTNVRRAQ